MMSIESVKHFWSVSDPQVVFSKPELIVSSSSSHELDDKNSSDFVADSFMVLYSLHIVATLS